MLEPRSLECQTNGYQPESHPAWPRTHARLSDLIPDLRFRRFGGGGTAGFGTRAPQGAATPMGPFLPFSAGRPFPFRHDSPVESSCGQDGAWAGHELGQASEAGVIAPCVAVVAEESRPLSGEKCISVARRRSLISLERVYRSSRPPLACAQVNVPKTKKAYCKGRDCKKHTLHKVTQYKSGKASLYAQGRSLGDGAGSAMRPEVAPREFDRPFSPLSPPPPPWQGSAVTTGSSPDTVVRPSPSSTRRPRPRGRLCCVCSARSARPSTCTLSR